MKGQGIYFGERVSILNTINDEALIIICHNPLATKWVKLEDITNIVWLID